MTADSPSKKSSPAKLNAAVLAHLLRRLITERYKRMARGEVLSKFASSKVDPAVWVDFASEAEREALDLAEMSLLQLVDSGRMRSELLKSSEKIQTRLEMFLNGAEEQKILNECVSPELIEKRVRWLAYRVEFYRKWISISEIHRSPLALARAAFRKPAQFKRALEPVLKADREMAEELVRSTSTLNRFLMKKQLDHELESALRVWEEFIAEAFKEPAALP